MDARKLTKLRQDLTSFLDDVVGTMGNPRRRRWCDAYLRGVLLDGHRKSVEPMAARLKTIELGSEDYEQALQQFLNQSRWDEQTILDGLQTWIARQFGGEGVLIIDDTGFPKQGQHSVGVARQYTGTLGKVASCQVAVTLQYATATEVVGLDAKLYLPKVWTEDAPRLAQAGVPESVGYQPKWQLALALLRRASANGFRGLVLADSLFGTVTAFRQQLEADDRLYCVGIDSTLKVIAVDADLGPIPKYSGRGQPPTRPWKVRAGMTSPSVKQWALDHAKDFRQVTWRQGSKGKMTGRFAAWRVRPAHKLSAGKEPLAACWLLAEWPEDAAAPTKYFFSNLPPATSLKRLVATAKSRWWVEHSYRELKDELGLDHFDRLVVAICESTAEVKYFVSNDLTAPLAKLLAVAFRRATIEHGFRLAKQEAGLMHFEGRHYVALQRHLILSLLVVGFVAVHTERLRGEKSAGDGGAGLSGVESVLSADLSPSPRSPGVGADVLCDSLSSAA